MDEKLSTLVKLWFLKADHDLGAIENEFNSDNPITDIICFHAQQAAEKYLKSFLVFNQIPFSNTHDLGKLINICTKKDSDFLTLKPAILLSEYAVELRYPDDFYIPEIEEAKEAFDVAKKVKTFVIQKIEGKCNLL